MILVEYIVRWTQGVREQIYQDESRYRGTQRVESTVRILAPTEKMATEALSSVFHDSAPEVVSSKVLNVHQIVTYDRKTLDSVTVDKVLEKHDNDPFKGES